MRSNLWMSSFAKALLFVALLTLSGCGESNSMPQPLSSLQLSLLRDIEFRRGVNGEGIIIIDLPNNQIGVDVRQQSNSIVVDFLKTGLPASLRRRLDVVDFGTPVSTVTTVPQGDNVHMLIEAKGLWEYSVYQSDTQLVVEIRPIK